MTRWPLAGIALLLITNLAYTQVELTLHLFTCATLPNGDFSKDLGVNPRVTRRAGFDVGDKVGLAQPGFGAGAELITPVWFKGLQWVFGAKVLANDANEKTAQAEFRALLGDSADLQFKYGRWVNIPVMTGFRYDYHFTHRYTLYGILQAGINVSKAASRKAYLGQLTVEDTQFFWTRDFGVEVGLGFVIDQTYNIGFRYLALNSPRYEGTRWLSEKMFPQIFSRENAILGEERAISMFVVTLGIQLFR